jgi:nucleotide-binding universal stress UspA family protein
MLESILVPLDGSLLAESVLPHVVAMARAFDAKAILLRVVGQNRARGTTHSVDPLNWQINKTETTVYLKKIDSHLQEAGVKTEIVAREGLAADLITDFADAERISLIMLSTHGQSGLTHWSMGSVVQRIISSAPTSLLIVRAHEADSGELTEHHYRRILVPLDGSWRAEHVLPMVISLARFHQSQIHLVHVVKKPEMARHMPPTQEDIDLSDRIVARNQEEICRYFELMQMRSPQEGIDVQTHVLISEDVATALHDFVEREHINLVALSAHGYSGNSQWPYGSIANNFIDYGKVPLLLSQDLQRRERAASPDTAIRQHMEH